MRKNLTIKILVAVLLLVFASGLIFTQSGKIIEDDNGKVEITPIFTQGNLNSDGTYVESETSAYTKNMFRCKGLEINLDFEADFVYSLFLYGSDGTFINCYTDRSTSWKGGMTDNVYYARIVIRPSATSTEKINLIDIAKMSSKLTIKVLADQGELPQSNSNSATE
ncbi:MAG: hypothetical protein E7339_00205 [Clostridiales bacterium]|nr:hypothetical protein [Clostridiales bacterium]